MNLEHECIEKEIADLYQLFDRFNHKNFLTADLYQIVNKSNGHCILETVCRHCAIKVHNDKSSKYEVYYDGYATHNFNGMIDEDGNEFEICPICESKIPRNDEYHNYIIPQGIKERE